MAPYLSQKTQRHVVCSTIAPPTSGPRRQDTANVEDVMPNREDTFPWVSFPEEYTKLCIPPPPRPWIARTITLHVDVS